MAETDKQPASESRNEHPQFDPARLVLVFAVIALGGLCLWQMYGPDQGPQPDDVLQQTEEHNRIATQKLAQLEDAMLAKSKVRALQVRVKSVQKTIDRLELLATDWQRRTADLMTSNEGRRFTQDPDLVESIVELLNSEVIASEEIERMRADTNGIDTWAETALESGILDQPMKQETIEKLDEYQKAAADAIVQFEQCIRKFDLLARRAAPTASPIAPTLEETLETIKTNREAALQRKVEETRRQAREEREQLLIRQAKQEEQALTEQQQKEQEELARLEREKQAARARATAAGVSEEIAEIDDATARKKLLDDFQRDLPEIKSLLSPFVSDGKTQPDPRKKKFELSGSTSPVSWQAIQAAGMVDDTPEGHRRLHYVANRDNDRPLGSFPEYIGNEYHWKQIGDRVIRAQQLLQKYGGLMVEKQMLAK